jgi:hypothetical protein
MRTKRGKPAHQAATCTAFKTAALQRTNELSVIQFLFNHLKNQYINIIDTTNPAT